MRRPTPEEFDALFNPPEAFSAMRPKPGPFIPYATMFKLTELTRMSAPLSPARMVQCEGCKAKYPLESLLVGELNADECPACHTETDDHWAAQAHRSVPHA